MPSAPEPFESTFNALDELHRRAATGTQLALLEGPADVGLEALLRLLADRTRGLAIRARARRGHPLAPFEDMVVPLLERRARRSGHEPIEHGLRCIEGCHDLWFEHRGATGAIVWDRLADRRASLFDGMSRLLATLGDVSPPIVVIDTIEDLDGESGELIACLLEQETLGVTAPGALFVAVAPEVEPPALTALRSSPCVHRVAVHPLGVEELTAYLARPDIASAVHSRTAGMVDRLAALLFEAPSVAPRARPAEDGGELARRAREAIARRDPQLGSLALRAAEALVARHAPEQAEQLLSEAVEHASARRCASLAGILAHLAELRGVSGDLPGALDAAEQLRALGDPDGDLRVARVLVAAGRIDEARATLERALEHADPRGRREAATALARLALSAADYERAGALARRALEDAEDDEASMEARNVLGNIAWSRGELDEAERLHLENERAAAPRIRMKALNNLALVELSRGKARSARSRLERMMELARVHGAARDRGIALENLGVLDRLEGRYADAIAHYQAAVRLLKPLGERALLARVATNLAEVYAVLGDARRSLALVELAESFGPAAQSPELRAWRLLVASEAREIAGELAFARRLAEEALTVAEAAGYRVAVQATIRLAALEQRAGEADAATRRLDVLGAVSLPRDRARLATLRARLAGTLHAALHAVDLSREAGEENAELEARAVHVAALLEAGMLDDADDAHAEASALVGRMMERVPPELRDTFRSKPALVQLAQLGEALARSEARAPSGARSRPSLERIAGGSAPMRQVRAWLERVAPATSTVLVLGESGTGKELLAEALHDLSPRRDAPFVRVNCGALTETLRASELFGHERGAFTGADRQRPGYFELANGGTIFLDEIGEAPPSIQVALLRVLQERVFHRVGGQQPIQVDVRVVAATNCDLEAMVVEGRFRRDLYYRLSGLSIRMPPLRERLADLPALTAVLLERIAGELGVRRLSIDASGIAWLARHPWPGNVRELESVLRSVAILSGARALGERELREHASLEREDAARDAVPSLEAQYFAALDARGSIYDLRRELERAAIVRALAEAKGNISRAALRLGMKRPRLSQLVREYGLKEPGRGGDEEQGES